MPASDLTLTPEQIEEGRRLNREADPGRAPFGLQQGVPPYGTPDECYVTDASGLCLWNERGALDRPADGRLIAYLLTHRDAILSMSAGYIRLQARVRELEAELALYRVGTGRREQ